MAEHFWPLCPKAERTTCLIANSRSLNAVITVAFLPPVSANSRWSGRASNIRNAVAVPPSGSLVVVPDGMFWNNRKTIIELAAAGRVPAIYPEREYADDGGLIGYGPNAPEHFRQAASYVDRILRGAKPADLPINASTRFDFVINLRSARALGFNLTADFISAADEVIE